MGHVATPALLPALRCLPAFPAACLPSRRLAPPGRLLAAFKASLKCCCREWLLVPMLWTASVPLPRAFRQVCELWRAAAASTTPTSAARALLTAQGAVKSRRRDRALYIRSGRPECTVVRSFRQNRCTCLACIQIEIAIVFVVPTNPAHAHSYVPHGVRCRAHQLAPTPQRSAAAPPYRQAPQCWCRSNASRYAGAV